MGGVSTGVRSEPLRHTLVRQALPKTKVTGSGAGGVRSKTPSIALSPTGEGVAARNGGKTGRPWQIMLIFWPIFLFFYAPTSSLFFFCFWQFFF